MRVGTISKAIVVAATVAWITGCSSTGSSSDSSETMEQDTQQQDQASSSGTGSDSSMESGQMDHDAMMAQQAEEAKAALAALQSVFYFDFDKAVVPADAFEDLSAHAKYLSMNPDARLVLEGHADERGTREYNMALGERRAKAVSRFMTVQGAASNQIEVVSYGEERPAMMGHEDGSWAKNRRVELKYSH